MSKNINILSNMIIQNIFINKLYLGIFFISIILAFSVPMIGNKLIIPQFYNEVIYNILDEAKRVGKHVETHMIKDLDNKTNKYEKFLEIKNDFSMEKIKLFSNKGKTLYSTDKKDIGVVNTHTYFHTEIAKGKMKYKVVNKGKTNFEGHVVEKDVAEIYVPIIPDNIFIGAIEVYYDITDRKERLLKLTNKINFISTSIALFLLVLLLLALYQASKKDLLDKEKDKMLFQKSNQSSLGEMIGNIAHQWRQPLSAITTASTSIELEHQLGILSDDDLLKNTKNITKNANHLSQTIETFRNFLKNDKEFTDVSLQDTLNNTLDIINSAIKNQHIEIKTNFIEKELKVHIISAELSEAIINIINNARDILISKEIHNPQILISLKEVENHAIISIEDNAGGISKDIQNKIFEPYFTTKHKSQGTGLGLHMTYKIITESLKGHLYTKNNEKGAVFFIELPLSI